MPDDKNRIDSLEDRIRGLCTKVVESTEEEALRRMCRELRVLLSEHIDLLRVHARGPGLTVKDLASEPKTTQLDSGKKRQGHGPEGTLV